jgi:hypothetical protein
MNSVVLGEVELFVKRWNAGELVLTPQANNMIITYSTDEKNFLGKPKMYKKTLPDYLGFVIATYQELRERGRVIDFLDQAYQLMDTIQRARAFQCIVDKTQQVTDYQQQIENLKKQNSSLRDLNAKLARENKMLRNLLPPNTRVGDTEVGDVE